MTAPYRFVKRYPDLVRKEYEVLDRESGEVLGRVEYREQHYNLARPLTVKFWIAKPADGGSIKIEGGMGQTRAKPFNTRALAADALYDLHHNKET